jgi:hypothetical protein
MLPRHHIIFGAALLVFTETVTLFQAFIAFLSSFLVDVDHYLIYVFRTKNLSFKKAYGFFVESTNKIYYRGYRCPLFIFHTIEFLIIIAVLSIYFKIFLFVIAGVLLHWALDWYVLLKNKVPYAKNFCGTHYILTRKKYKII